MNAARYLAAVLALAVLAGLPAGATDATASPGGGGKRRDTAPPSIAVSGVQQAASSTVTVSGTAADNVGVARVDLSVDGGLYAVAQGTSTWTYVVDTSRLPVGTHTVTARASDAAGNKATATASFAVGPAADTSPPAASFTLPTPNANISGTATIAGTAGDNAQLAKVELSVDGGAYRVAQGTANWSVSLDTSAYANGPHTLTARATDAAGNVGTATETVDVLNDLAAPTVAITSPAQSATVAGVTSVSGTAADDRAVASVELSVDGSSYQAVQGTTSWSYSLDTTSLNDGSHTLAARATDTSGKSTSTSLTVTVSNPPPAGGDQTLVTPEGATITVASDVAGWTPQQVYDLLKPNAYQLALIGPSLTIKVQTLSASQTATSLSRVNGAYTACRSTIYLRANGSSGFDFRPDQVIAHEYGHAWTTYHLYMTQNGDWTRYLQARGLAGDARVDTTYNWNKSEMIADDYRILFGTVTAQNQLGYINPDAPDPRTVAGLRDFFVNTWAKP